MASLHLPSCIRCLWLVIKFTGSLVNSQLGSVCSASFFGQCHLQCSWWWDVLQAHLGSAMHCWRHEFLKQSKRRNLTPTTKGLPLFSIFIHATQSTITSINIAFRQLLGTGLLAITKNAFLKARCDHIVFDAVQCKRKIA